MGMSTHVVGFVKPDDDYAKKVAAWRACEAACVTPPNELIKLFDGNPPQDAGMNVDITQAVSSWNNDYASGYEVDITKLPSGVRIVRFYNSW
jgi:hypothetical protein